jgi:hypothetical protein
MTLGVLAERHFYFRLVHAFYDDTPKIQMRSALEAETDSSFEVSKRVYATFHVTVRRLTMEKDKGVLYLRPLYKFIKERQKKGEGSGDAFEPYAYRRRPVKKGYEYSAKCLKILTNAGVPMKRGFYLWGFYNHQKFWVNVYFGMSEIGKKASDLRARILEELKDERAFIWREFYETGRIINFEPNYRKEVKRALRKAGATHIFWVAAPHLERETFEAVEYDLIEAMNPTGNRRRRKPSRIVQPKADEILSTFRELIHGDRDEPKSQYKLKYHKEFWKWVGEVDPPTP